MPYFSTWKFIEYVTVFRKTNRSMIKSIIVYARKYKFEHEDSNGNIGE